MTGPGVFAHPAGEQQAFDDVPTGPPPLDQPQTFSGAGSYDVRDELGQLIERDLLGPRGGETEQFAPKAGGPRERYLVGMLGPKHEAVSTLTQADEVPDTEDAVRDGEAELPDVITRSRSGGSGHRRWGCRSPCRSTWTRSPSPASWGHYTKHEIPVEDGKKARVWVREPVRHAREVRLDGAASYKVSLSGGDEDAPGVLFAVSVRLHADRKVVELALINNQREPRPTPTPPGCSRPR